MPHRTDRKEAMPHPEIVFENFMIRNDASLSWGCISEMGMNQSDGDVSLRWGCISEIGMYQ